MFFRFFIKKILLLLKLIFSYLNVQTNYHWLGWKKPLISISVILLVCISLF